MIPSFIDMAFVKTPFSLYIGIKARLASGSAAPAAGYLRVSTATGPYT